MPALCVTEPQRGVYEETSGSYSRVSKDWSMVIEMEGGHRGDFQRQTGVEQDLGLRWGE